MRKILAVMATLLLGGALLIHGASLLRPDGTYPFDSAPARAAVSGQAPGCLAQSGLC